MIEVLCIGGPRDGEVMTFASPPGMFIVAAEPPERVRNYAEIANVSRGTCSLVPYRVERILAGREIFWIATPDGMGFEEAFQSLWSSHAAHAKQRGDDSR